MSNHSNQTVNVIELINQLQTLHLSVDLPSLVVIGAQSSGKSSLINHLCGYEILPIGMDMVTKQPLILQLVHIDKSKDDDDENEEYAEFLHLKNSVPIHQVQQELLSVSKSIQHISSTPIYLKLFSKHVVNLTLIDLPGLIQIPTIHQPNDLDEQIYQLVSHYAKKENSLLLAVSTCMNDLSTSDALRLCRMVDGQGKRTIGVLTKCDMFFNSLKPSTDSNASNNGTLSLHDILVGKTYPLYYGFTAVINKPGIPGDFQQSHVQSREMEHELFTTHFPSIAHKCGVFYLLQLLHKILTNHIKQQLPDLKSKISLMMHQHQLEYDQFGPVHEVSLSSLLRILSSYSDKFNKSIDGQADTLELCAGARIYYLYHTVYQDHLLKVMPLDQLTDQDIKTAIRNATGPRTTLFIPEKAFELLIKPQLKRLRAPAIKCVDLVFDELVKVSLECCTKDVQRYPKLSTCLTGILDINLEIVDKLLRQKLDPCRKYVDSLVQIQMAYINTNHPDFIGVGAAMEDFVKDARDSRLERIQNSHQRIERSKSPQPRTSNRPNSMVSESEKSSTVLDDASMLQDDENKEGSLLQYFFKKRDMKPVQQQQQQMRKSTLIPNPNDGFSLSTLPSPTTPGIITPNQFHTLPDLTEKEQFEVQLIRKLMISYFEIVRQSLLDLVPKAIMHNLVNAVCSDIHPVLVEALYQPDKLQELFMEDELIIKERTKVKEILEKYKQANEVLASI